MASSGKRHRLLLYTRLFGKLRMPALLIALMCGVLWWFAPRPFDSLFAQAGLLAATVSSGLLFLYAQAGLGLSYVQCRPSHLRLRTPLFSLAISYNRIRTVRPVELRTALRPVPWSQESLVEPFLGRTVVALDLKGYPMKEKWLRLWVMDLMFAREFTGLLLVTEDWMALSRDLEVHRGEWKTRYIDERRQAAAPGTRSGGWR